MVSIIGAINNLRGWHCEGTSSSPSWRRNVACTLLLVKSGSAQHRYLNILGPLWCVFYMWVYYSAVFRARMPYACQPRATRHMLVDFSGNNSDVILCFINLLVYSCTFSFGAVNVARWWGSKCSLAPPGSGLRTWDGGTGGVGDRARVHCTPQVRVTVHHVLAVPLHYHIDN